MSTERVLRFEVPSREVLDRLASGSLPSGIDASPPERDFRRDVYYDTAGADLEKRGVTVRLSTRSDGVRLLNVDVRERSDADRITRRHAEEGVGDEEATEIFMASSEPARLLRSMTDPARLSARLELETTRWSRRLKPAATTSGAITMLCDAVTLRFEDLVAEFEEVELQFAEAASDDLDAVASVLQRELGLRATLASKLSRAREALENLEIHSLEERVRGSREVGVIAHRDGMIGMLGGDDGTFRVPTGRGWGEQNCRKLLRSLFGNAQGQVRILGETPGLAGRPALQVWLAQHATRDGAEPEGFKWVPLAEMLDMVGSTELRDARTLSALHLAARRGLPPPPAPLSSARARPAGEHPFRLGERKRRKRPEIMGDEGESQPLPHDLLINMELSELSFNERVLALAADPRTPLLERVRFLSILGSNLDEFFMTRVAGFHHQVASGSTKKTLDGLTAEEQLDVIGVRARQIYSRAYDFLWTELLPELEASDIQLLSGTDLDESDRDYLSENYASQLGAVLTPLAADPSHPFPHIRNLRPHLGVVVRVPETGAEHFAAIELPGDLPRFVPLPGGRRFIPLEEIIVAALPMLYAGLDVVAAHTFRVTRSANFTLEEEPIGDLLRAVEEKVQQRPLGPVVRLEVETSMPSVMRELLLRELQFESQGRLADLRDEDVYPVDRLVDLFALHEIADLPVEEAHYPPIPRESPLDPERRVWPQLREREVLVRFPFDSFEATVERVLAEAARDPQVVSIRVTLYRTSRSSKVVKLLRKARRRGKDVVALVELKASFDEKRNIEWARSLESAGIHVVYGPPDLKVHAKIALVTRKEKEGLRQYVYIGTGNLNAATAAGYTDLGLLSTDQRLGGEVQDVFNGLTGYSITSEYEHLLVAPFNMRKRFMGMIDRETEHAKAGRDGRIAVKINGLTDRELIAALYRASQAGVRVDLIVRGICALRPGVEGVSENIRVISVLGRFLEHARIYHFHNHGDPEYFIGSADWRPRNLSRRVEIVAPIRDPEHRSRLDEIIDSNLANPDAWQLRSDGVYEQMSGGQGSRLLAVEDNIRE
jgi:polyphosphate kinase